MAKNKLKKFAEMATFENVVQPHLDEVLNKDYKLKGKWNSEFFKNDNPIVLELGCGKGEYSTGLAERYPDKNFLGVDIKGSRMWKGASHAINTGLKNVGFLRTRIEHIASFFAPGEISEIWITFPDPQEKRIRAKKRLTSSIFLASYKKFIKPSGIIHLKTDNTLLYNYTCALCSHNGLDVKFSTADLYNSNLNEEVLLSIKTHYEALFTAKGMTIKYLRFTLDGHDTFIEPPQNEDDE
ncbi:MAG: tRNA (guanosine(46)-N7)-methyltransferase TrmB [Bacteroidota bacterium]|nr:tRNA (guanosine(46)-N7)-methyltransferase TrmB [Bacteroidota bacterium]